MSVSLCVNIWLFVPQYMYVVYHGVSVCMCMCESLASSCGFMPRSPSRCLACSPVSAELGIGTLRMSLENRKTIKRAFGQGFVARNSYENLPACNDMLFSGINIFFQLCVSSH